MQMQDSSRTRSRAAAIITVSDTRSAGTASDETRGMLRDVLLAAGWGRVDVDLVPDERAEISASIEAACERGCLLVLTTGGTGLGPRDVTPEATRSVIDREVPGITELFRAAGARATPMSWLSRAIAGQRGTSLVANLPGNPNGAVECLRLLLPLAEHAEHVMRGGGHMPATSQRADGHSA